MVEKEPKKFEFQIDMDNLNPEVWFGDEPGKRVCLRLCPPDKVEEFRKECTTVTRQLAQNKTSRNMEIVKDADLDDAKFVRLVNGYSIVDWDLKDVKGQPVAYTEENKAKLMNVIPFMQFISEGLKELAKQAGITQEDELKNFATSQGE